MILFGKVTIDNDITLLIEEISICRLLNDEVSKSNLTESVLIFQAVDRCYRVVVKNLISYLNIINRFFCNPTITEMNSS